jgi:hypothetical protein
MSRLALAEPKVAVAPLENDDGKIAEVIGEIVSERAKLTKPARVEGAMKSMGVSVLSAKSLKKLRGKLDVDVVIYGSVEKAGAKKRVTLTFAGSNKDRPKLEVVAAANRLRKELEGKVAKRIETAMEGSGGDEEEEEEEEDKEAERKAREEERKRKEEEAEQKIQEEKRRKQEEEQKREEEARRKKRDEEDNKRRKNRDDEEDEPRKKKRVAEEDEEDGSRARKRLEEEEETDEADGDDTPRRKRKRHALTHAALWADAGGAFARRTLTWESTGMNRPPPVGTLSPAGQIAGEVYPAAFGSLKSTAAGIGVYGEYSRTFALGLIVPGTMITTPIKNGHYAVGARYRFVFDQHSLAVGAGFYRRWFMADRTKLMMPDQLDMPDIDCKAIAPGVVVRIAATPKVAAFATVDVPLVLSSGPIQLPASYGAARILAFDVQGGAQIVLTDKIALQVAAEFAQLGFSFTGQPGSKASTRQVKKATDRSIGFAATVGFAY